MASRSRRSPATSTCARRSRKTCRGYNNGLMRTDRRTASQLRDTTITPDYLIHAEGSVLIQAGNTKVICAASVEDRVPPFLRNSGKGWVTAEYGMLPRATTTRMQREASAGKVGG